MKNFRIIIYSSIFFGVNSLQCVDNLECPRKFHVPAEIIPYLLEYHIGDTIRMVSKFDRHVHELETDKIYDMENINWIPNTVVQFLDTIGRSKITNYFEFQSNSNYKEYTLSKGQSELEGQYTYEKDTYYLEFILIPKYVGNYFLIQKCGINANNICRHSDYIAIVDMNIGKDGNFELLKTSKDTLFNKLVISALQSQFYDKGGFCFRVVP